MDLIPMFTDLYLRDSWKFEIFAAVPVLTGSALEALRLLKTDMIEEDTRK